MTENLIITAERLALLLALWSEPLSKAEIIARLSKLPGPDITPAAFEAIRRKLKLSRSLAFSREMMAARNAAAMTEARLTRMRAMRVAGHTPMAISRAVKSMPGPEVAEHHIRKLLRQEAPPKPRPAAEEDEDFAEAEWALPAPPPEAVPEPPPAPPSPRAHIVYREPKRLAPNAIDKARVYAARGARPHTIVHATGIDIHLALSLVAEAKASKGKIAA